MTEVHTLILGILHVFLKLSLKRRNRQRKGKTWKAPKNLCLVDGDRCGERQRGLPGSQLHLPVCGGERTAGAMLKMGNGAKGHVQKTC